MKKKHWMLLLKFAVLGTVLGIVGYKLHEAWVGVGKQRVAIDWRWGGIAVAGFCSSMLTSAWVWRWLAGRMGGGRGGRERNAVAGRGDGLPTIPLLGAYTFSQMGKYIPGKVGLLFMRIERAGRMGMSASVCTISTLLENALYVISGGLLGLMALVRIVEELRVQGIVGPRLQHWMWPLIAVVIAALVTVCHPAVFFGLVNRALRLVKKPEVPRRMQVGMGVLALAVVGFVPCWLFGGVSMWASTMCVQHVEIASCWWFAGAYALSVIIGMVIPSPGGIGIREVVLGVAVTLQLTPVMGHDRAVLTGAAAAVLQRLFQVITEVVLGVGGAVMTGRGQGIKERTEAVRQ